VATTDPAADPSSGSGAAAAPLDLNRMPASAPEFYAGIVSVQGTPDARAEIKATKSAPALTDERADESTKGYGPQDQARDTTRQIITLWLIGLFCVLIVMSFVALFIVGLKSPGGFDDAFFMKLKTLLDVLLGPVITLLSSAIGFYFGYQQATSVARNDAARTQAGLTGPPGGK